MPDLDDRVTLLERLAAQQLNLNDQLLDVTKRLGDEHALYQERQTLLTHILAQYDERGQQHHEQMRALRELMGHHDAQMAFLRQLVDDHETRMTRMDDQLAQQQATHRALVEGIDRLEAVLVAIKDLLRRDQGH